MDQPFVSFIILSYNRKDPLSKAIRSAQKQRYERKEVIVVDNGSIDGTPIMLEEEFPDVTVVSLRDNLGLPIARNHGIDASRGDILIFLDDDCVLDGDNAVDLVVRQFQADPGCGAIGFRILDPKARQEWPYGLYQGQDAPVAFEAALFRGGAVALRRKTLDEIGFFWAPLFIVHEDLEMAFRLAVAGWRIMGRNDIITWHPAPNPLAAPNPRREIYFKLRNTIWLAIRHMPVILMPRFLLPVLARGFYHALRSGNMTYFIHAVTEGLRGTPRCLRQRRPISVAWVRRARALRMTLW